MDHPKKVEPMVRVAKEEEAKKPAVSTPAAGQHAKKPNKSLLLRVYRGEVSVASLSAESKKALSEEIKKSGKIYPEKVTNDILKQIG